MRKGRKKLVILVGGVILVVVWIAFCGYQWSWGPFNSLYNLKIAGHEGNAKQYSAENQAFLGKTELTDKTIVFLGSSVTYGSASKGVSFADYLKVRNDCSIIKEAVSGTTLVDSGLNSYVRRIKKIDKEANVDMLVCQLSTNDATQNKTLGKVSGSTLVEEFDTQTVAGAIEYIIAYSKENWGASVVFFTNPQYESDAYADMVGLLNEIANKWNITVIDMWNDQEFNSIKEEERKLYMVDSIHPSQAGYLKWWTPYFEEKLLEMR